MKLKRQEKKVQDYPLNLIFYYKPNLSIFLNGNLTSTRKVLDGDDTISRGKRTPTNKQLFKSSLDHQIPLGQLTIPVGSAGYAN